MSPGLVVVLVQLLVVVHRGGLVDHSVEAIVLVGGVVHGADGTVGLHQRVLSFDGVAVAGLVLGLDIAGVEVIHSVFEGVLGRGLRMEYY